MDEWIGYLAGAATTLAFLPQVVKVWRTRSVRDLSLGMYLVITTGVALWIWYGARIGSAPVVVSNALILAQTVLVLVAKIRFSEGRGAGRRRCDPWEDPPG
jgi:MtN3 and saliva related transmembrane protein